MGYQHPGENGQWPHLDQLYGHGNIDLVSFDNYLPLSDWTTGDGGLDARNWLAPAPTGAWPPASATFNGLGLTGQPTIYSLDYLKANIEGGQNFNWFYNDSNNVGIGLDPNGTDLRVSLPQGDRLAQSRNAYAAEPGVLAAQATALVVEQSITRRSMTTVTVPAWAPHGRVHRMGAAIEVDHLRRVWLPGVRSRHQPAERVLRAGERRKLHAVLVDLGSERERRRRLCAAPRRHSASARAPGGLRILGDRRQQRDRRRRRADDPDRVHVGLELGRAAVSDIPAACRRLGRRRQLAGRATGSAARGRSYRCRRPDSPPSPGPYPIFPAMPTLGWSAKYSPLFSTEIGAARVRPRGARGEIIACRSGGSSSNYDLLRMVSPYTELQQIVGFFDAVPGRERGVLFRAAGAVAGRGAGARHGRRRDDDFPFRGDDRRLRAVAGRRRRGVRRLSRTAWRRRSGYAVNAGAPAPSRDVRDAARFGRRASPRISTGHLLCRFDDDSQDVEEFMAQLYALQSLRLQNGARMTTPPSLPVLAGRRLVAAQEARILHAHRFARVRPRSARRADGTIRSTNSRRSMAASLRRDGGFRRPRRGQPAKPDGLLPSAPGPVRHVPLHRSGRRTGRPRRRSRTGNGADDLVHDDALARRLARAGRLGDRARQRLSQRRGAGRRARYYADAAEHARSSRAAPGHGVAISADFSYAFNCRFLDDQMDFEEFMSGLWRLESMKFRSVKSWLGG